MKQFTEILMKNSNIRVKKELYANMFRSVIENSDDPAYIFESDKICRIEKNGGGFSPAIVSAIEEDFMLPYIAKDFQEYLEFKKADIGKICDVVEQMIYQPEFPDKLKEELLEMCNPEKVYSMLARILQFLVIRRSAKKNKKSSPSGLTVVLHGEDNNNYKIVLSGGASLLIKNDDVSGVTAEIAYV